MTEPISGLAVVPPGLEAPAAAELTALGAHAVVPLRRAVRFQTDLAGFYRLHLQARLPFRLLRELTHFPCYGKDDLYDGVQAAVDWLHWLPPEASFRVDASGSAQQTSVWLQKYLVRGFRTNVLARAQLDAMNLRDQVAASDTKTLRQMHKQNVEISGDSNVAWLGNANHNFAAALHFGQLGFDDAQAQAADSAAAKTEGKFSYVTLRLNRNQALSSAASLYLVWSGQWAGGNLDASQKFSLGGPNSVRAYESGAISGDNGQLATIELRYALPALAALPSLGQWQAVLFADYGQLKINQNPWSAASNEASLGGVGLGLNWQSPAGWRAKLSLATTTGDRPLQLANANAARSSAWVELRRDF